MDHEQLPTRHHNTLLSAFTHPHARHSLAMLATGRLAVIHALEHDHGSAWIHGLQLILEGGL